MLTRITGVICITGFGLDMLAMSLYPNLSSVEWRMGYFQYLGERAILLLFGGALLSGGLHSLKSQRQWIAYLCCVLGFSLTVGGFFYLQDSTHFKSLAIENLRTQQQKLEQQIQDFPLTENRASAREIVSANKEKALRLLGERTQTLDVRAKARIKKTVTRTFSSLLLAGVGLVTLGLKTLRFEFKRQTRPAYPHSL